MLDFLKVLSRSTKRGSLEIYPEFFTVDTEDLMIRGNKFYAIWNEEKGFWSTQEKDAVRLIDKEIDEYYEAHKTEFSDAVRVQHLRRTSNGYIDEWHKFCKQRMWNTFVPLDQTLTFSNSPTKKKDYASKKLPYPLEKASTPAYNRLMSVLYSPEERKKIEWAIGAIVTGDSRFQQKFIVLYGAPGSGKGTVISLIEKLFEGYVASFDAKSLGNSNKDFALEAFRDNPLVAIQHDGNLSKIEDNTRLNSLISHEKMLMNVKYESAYNMSFHSFLFIASNSPVEITDAKSGLMRRLIDVTPTGQLLDGDEYDRLLKQIEFELGGIAWHCKKVYEQNKRAYEHYRPITMLSATNDFYNFILDSYSTFEKEDETTLGTAWDMYKRYCEEARVPYPYPQRKFKEELKNYFKEYYLRAPRLSDGSRPHNYYKGFHLDTYGDTPVQKAEPVSWLDLKQQVSQLDILCAEDPAQLATIDGSRPLKKWINNTNRLKDISTSLLHFLQPKDRHHIFVDFDLRDAEGKKCLQLNLEAASKWPPTYAEVSKSGEGIHLHYIYTGDPNELNYVYAPGIEIKVCTGDMSIRRKLSLCNSLPIASISSGLPRKEEKVVNFKAIESEKQLRTMIAKCLNKEYENLPNTAPNVDFIKKLLDDAAASGVPYDISDMHEAILRFATQSSNQKEKCVKTVAQMQFKSEEPSVDEGFQNDSEDDLVFFDIEVFPNLLLINYKFRGPDKPVIRLINPEPDIVKSLFRLKLVGFNNRGYDNHIIYARGQLEYTIEQIFKLSQRIIAGAKDAKFGEAFNISYADIHEFATVKQSLKKWEIELGIHHQELGLPWNEPVPEEKWAMVSEYCDNDVLATEALFEARQGDWKACKILAALTGRTPNDNGNSMAEQFIFGSDKNPQAAFNWRDLSKPVRWSPELSRHYRRGKKFRIFDSEGHPTYEEYIPGVPIPEGYSILPFFPKYRFIKGKSYWLSDDELEMWKDTGYDPKWQRLDGKIIGEGGAVYGLQGIWTNVDDEDVSSMHPHSATADDFFGPVYTQRFEELVEARVAIKHGDLELAGSMLDGALKPFLTEEDAKDLAQALKIVINKVYGMSAAKYDNRFRDPNNVDNFIAKRGALFMYMLREEVLNRGYLVAHIKTDSIKIPDATPEIVDFVRKFGAEYGYTFEQEALFDRFCLVNDAVYVAKTDKGEWTATGTQFQIPYVFKSLFSKEPIVFEDMCEAKSVTTALYLGERDDEDHCDEPRFIGKVGLFCPMLPGCGGRKLLRQSVDKDGNVKYSAVVGTKDYYWMESELVKNLGLEDKINRGYYDKLVNDAIDTINQFGSYELFVADEPYPHSDNLPF